MNQSNDKYLLNTFKENPNYGFNLIVREYQKRLYFQIRRLVLTHEDTDDVLQNTFIKAWKGLVKFRGDSKLSTWLFSIATNEALNHLRKNKKRLNDVGVEMISDKQASSFIDSNEIQIKLEKALLTLPEKQRIVFHLKYFEDLRYSEISKITSTSEGALKASYHLAVKKIETFLTQD